MRTTRYSEGVAVGKRRLETERSHSSRMAVGVAESLVQILNFERVGAACESVRVQLGPAHSRMPNTGSVRSQRCVTQQRIGTARYPANWQ